MMKNYKNKQISESENKGEELQEFHFAGGGEFEPVTICAHSPEEAVKEWERVRKKVEKNQIISE